MNAIPPPDALPTISLDDLSRGLAEHGWRSYPSPQLAATLGVTPAELQAAYPSPCNVLAALTRQFNQDMLQGYQQQGGEAVRDRLFDLIMRRFDAMLPHRPAIAKLMHDLWFQPLLKASMAEGLCGSLNLILHHAGAPTHGWQGKLAGAGLGLIYADTLRLWLKDNSSDQGRTMACLERHLERADGWAKQLRF
jgi:hypothetical protein